MGSHLSAQPLPLLSSPAPTGSTGPTTFDRWSRRPERFCPQGVDCQGEQRAAVFCRPRAAGGGTSQTPGFILTVCPAEADGRTAGDYGEEEEAAWYLTKAMAASSLQNSSSTTTPSRSVMWSTLEGDTNRKISGALEGGLWRRLL